MNSVASTLNRVTDMEFNNQISVLTQHNWNTWKHDMQVLLMHYGCWQFITQTKPEQPDEEATYKEKLDLQLHGKKRTSELSKIEAELILEANRLQLMKQDLEKAENAYLSSFTSKKSKTLPGATAAAHGDPNGKNDYQKKGGKPDHYIIPKNKEISFFSDVTAKTKNGSIEIWHQRFCHVNNDYLVKTSKNDSVKGLPRLTDNGKTHCIPCKLAKSKRVSFKKTGAVRSKRPLELLHMDLCGPMPTESQGGNKYFLSIIDDYSRKVTVFPIRNKSDVFHTFIRFQKRAERFLSKKILDENKRGINFRQKVNSNLGYNLNLPDYYDDEDDFDRVKDSLTSRLVSKTSTETPSTSEKPDVSSDNHSLIPCTEVKWIRNIGRKVTGSNVYYSIEGEATQLKSFNEIEIYCKRHNIEYDPSLFNFRKDNTESQGFSDLSEQQEALMVEVTIPNCYKQAIRSRDASKWHDAMDKEINVMMERKVWDLVDYPDNIKI
ncbi:retrovirus-related Pol polyprotein from transposon TNT 1-94 [Trichonephila clavipes]|nr:retrovirus-related Pol polyprotein from transposon TNT 1-94 [Trichonephila clavipes]